MGRSAYGAGLFRLLTMSWENATQTFRKGHPMSFHSPFWTFVMTSARPGSKSARKGLRMLLTRR